MIKVIGFGGIRVRVVEPKRVMFCRCKEEKASKKRQGKVATNKNICICIASQRVCNFGGRQFSKLLEEARQREDGVEG